MKTTITTTIVVSVVLALLPLATADFWQCFDRGEFIDFCGSVPDRISPNDRYSICVDRFNEENNCWVSGVYSDCLHSSPPCSGGGTNTTVDTTPPIIILNSPTEEGIYTKRSVLLDLNVNELSDIYYRNNNDPRRWTRVCTDCSSYSRKRTFEEGFNDLTFKAIDRVGNIAYFDLTFYIDSKEPNIRSTEPKSGFASGIFKITFDEDNPEQLVITYGNALVGFREHFVGIATECLVDRDYKCTTEINLEDFDGQQIQYYAVLTDIAGNEDISSTQKVEVDYSLPVINSLNFVVNGKYVTFTLDIAEPYFEKVVYIDNSEAKPKEKTLCSKLVNNLCEKKVSFTKDGSHELRIIVRDEAGNEAQQSVTVFTDSKKPSIKDVSPDKDFASGLFEIEFQEQNPDLLILNYGNSVIGFEEYEFTLADCTIDKANYYCAENVDLRDYENQQIEYWFVLTDIVNQTDEDGEDKLKVDVTFPVINAINYTVAGNKANVLLNITELNFDEVTYINNNDLKPREKNFCSKLTKGICQKSITLNAGQNQINFQVFDKAGNSIAQNLEILR